MEYSLKIAPEASEDIDGIYNYVCKDGESIAKKQVELIMSSLDSITTFPEMGEKLSNKVSVETDYRYFVIKKIYIVFYKIHENYVGVYRLLRSEQDYLKILGFE